MSFLPRHANHLFSIDQIVVRHYVDHVRMFVPVGDSNILKHPAIVWSSSSLQHELSSTRSFPIFLAMSSVDGIFAALFAYTIWGLSPLYWRMLTHVSADQLVMHRIVWSCVLVATLLMYTCRWHNFKAHSVTWDNVSLHATSALFIGTNWTLFVRAANAGYIVQTSLGGYILPLVTVLLGVVVLGEKLRPLQWVAIGIAALGVLIVSIGYGVVPWISFALATTEGIYSLLKKKATLGPLDGVMIETGALFLPSLGYLAATETHGHGAFGHESIGTTLLLLGAGVMATSTLVSFGYAVQRIPLTLIGVLRYVTPTIQVCLAVFFYHEHFSTVNLCGFVLLWSGLVLFTQQSYTAQLKTLEDITTMRDMDEHEMELLIDLEEEKKSLLDQNHAANYHHRHHGTNAKSLAMYNSI
ncbi:Aste57867_17382 [Aphanomyces stellatus]|uniref:Aste57867_17382 protein n=1 Tax=Aphanomyces stellatus TaxID=120398 RepID=A0A485L8E3_9STRA|nr:hypothetical protein As57867_017322 [Aphanomyces stellatus]VFT94138.1 Aste57867_17382 [Aphanomyces stellatus]